MKDTRKSKDSRYKSSEKLLERALTTVPLGSQTFTKSITQLPFGASPYFATHARGSRFWDVDGNEYVDFVNGLLSVSIGHCDKDIMAAVEDQLKRGTIFSLASELEAEVAEKICRMVPAAEMVRFGKNGSDATSGAIRLARAVTGRDHILACGYHGWQDWYIGSTTRDLGVPEAVKNLTHQFAYNDIDALTSLFDQNKNQIAAVILEPVNIEEPKNGFLEAVRSLTADNGALLIFDETITGFRYAKGGAQEFFGIEPDLSTFGKGLANGFPLSAVAGKAEYMSLMKDIFFSTTFGGETLSLAAASAVLDKINSEPVIESLSETGALIMKRLNQLIETHGLNDNFKVRGYPVWSFFDIVKVNEYSKDEIKTLFLQEMFASGIFTLGTHNISFAHSAEDIDLLMKSYDLFFQKIKEIQAKDNLHDLLQTEVLKPLFQVRKN